MNIYTGTLIDRLIESAEAVIEAWKRDSEKRPASTTDEQDDARLKLAESMGILRNRVGPVKEMASIERELNEPVYKEEREFSRFQHSEHLYGSENSQG